MAVFLHVPPSPLHRQLLSPVVAAPAPGPLPALARLHASQPLPRRSGLAPAASLALPPHLAVIWLQRVQKWLANRVVALSALFLGFTQLSDARWQGRPVGAYVPPRVF